MNRAKGYTLVELLVGMTIGLVVLASSLSLFAVNSEFGSKQLQSDFMRTQLDTIANTLKVEIARAGFCYDCASANPFLQKDSAGAISSILIDDSASKSDAGSCIRFAYNHDKRTEAVGLNKDDAKGFRLGSDSDGNAVIEIYENYNGLTNWNCSSTTSSGPSSYWRDMTFERLSITSLEFKRTHHPGVGSTNKNQVVEVTLTAALKTDSSISDTVSFSVSVPNVDG
ncbi:prepilin-type N-terminal cleavage/methylation domain-containing protein [Enterovibrio sp. ZSDZ35]|uniref:Prepilin-type N-terminal cleavage/methylation domain-containing protein n=1 Tax=Enterovibrio qingdaonensis TaxID=2899818 RepID=A0ABT5QUC9_9GAMM|nr:prepilin-type N-terminal cleavage/methylation domain-containing protein [Enterovibrio sp. ZSDZ35]MDD1784323.1 prepilin-type N-terminal cleavage/methylation domain-containing protein [Enterovibrio sp. ZSDZ35]